MRNPTCHQSTSVKKINLYEMYAFGKYLAPLTVIEPEAKVKQHLITLWEARDKLLGMADDGSPLLNTAKRAVGKLIVPIDALVPRNFGDAMNIPADLSFGWLHGPAIIEGIKELESVMGNEMPDVASYVASQKGIYRTDDLIAHAENHLSSESRKFLSAQACTDIREAGKCLAYEVSTACAFHLWRAVETVMGDYYFHLTGNTFQAAKISRNWGAYIAAMKAANADNRITTYLDHIRGSYRNPQTHPDEQVPVEEAQRLFNVALSSVEQMLLEIVTLSKQGALNALAVAAAAPRRSALAPPPSESEQ